MKVIFFPPEKGELQHVIYDFIMLVLYHFEQRRIIIIFYESELI